MFPPQVSNGRWREVGIKGTQKLGTSSGTTALKENSKAGAAKSKGKRKKK